MESQGKKYWIRFKIWLLAVRVLAGLAYGFVQAAGSLRRRAAAGGFTIWLQRRLLQSGSNC